MRLLLAWPGKLRDIGRPPRHLLSCRYLSTAVKRTDFQALDAKWQAEWQADAVRTRQDTGGSRGKKYVLPMFAYPSGTLHMGHLRVYTISDVLARYHRMRGFNVLHPTGWDAFGLPAENAAIERGVDPGQWTMVNIEKMKGQLKSMNTDFNWETEISTCFPNFYKHTQKLFLMLYRKGLAYQAEALVNYDPVDKTVLANEQVDSNGRSWRSGAVVEQRMLRQWFFRITAFQQPLLDDLDALSEDNRWPDRVIQQQRNWIGRSNGATIAFAVNGHMSDHSVNVFTTRPDTLFGVEYLALSLSHPIVQKLADSDEELASFITKRTSFAPDSKEGYELPLRAAHPASSLTGEQREIPVFAAPYVLEDYGEGAVMGVPAHDTRDFSFWKLHKPGNIPAQVIMPMGGGSANTHEQLDKAFTDRGILGPHCGTYAGLPSEEASSRIVQDLSKLGKAKETKTWRLRDWLISRQRYWGTPIPIVHCESCGAVPVPDDQLPIELPQLSDGIRGQKGNPLDSIKSFVNTECPSCGKPSKRETDTMDTFVDSSWYYARFPDSLNEKEIFSRESAGEMLPVDMYIGGVEHAILHLLYARFIYKFLCQEDLIPSTDDALSKEPFRRLIAQGMVHGKTFSDPISGRFLKPDEVVHHDGSPTLVKASGKEATISWEKMSKSKHNGVDPLSCFQKYGADVTRAHMLFTAPLSEVLQWDEEKIVGIQRWFYRVSRLVDIVISTKSHDSVSSIPVNASMQLPNLEKLSVPSQSLLLTTNATITSVTQTLENNMYNINTVVSDLIKFTHSIDNFNRSNKITELTPVADLQTFQTTVLTLLKLLAPIAPAFAEQCWEDIHLANASPDQCPKSIFDSSFPTPLLTPQQESSLLRATRKTQTCAVQINGKMKFTVEVPAPPQPAVGDGNGADDAVGSKERHEKAVIEKILESEQGKLWFVERGIWEKRTDVVFVKGGRVVNVLHDVKRKD